MRYELTVNGKSDPVETAQDTPLLRVLRDELGLTGTKFGCGMGLCGACAGNGEIVIPRVDIRRLPIGSTLSRRTS